jgi:serine/threonine protein phosphatase PrpC
MEPTDQPRDLHWHGVGLTDRGLIRATNQDCFDVHNEVGLWIVADGMGGHAGGGTASQLAVKRVTEYILAHEEHPLEPLLTSAIASADTLVRSTAADAPDLAGMGTTMVVGLLSPLSPSSIAIAHIGDSRAYLIRDRQIRALTTDHSLVQRLVAEGRISSEEAKTHPQQNVLLRAVGAENGVPADVANHALCETDIVLLCTDGLTKMIQDEEILKIVLNHTGDSAKTCQQLIQLANARGGKDNTTVVVISSDRTH